MPEPSAPKAASRRTARAPRHTWAQLLERTFAIDILQCTCGGRLRFLCWIFNPEALRAIERSLGRAPPQPPPSPPIRGSPQEAFPWAEDQAA